MKFKKIAISIMTLSIFCTFSSCGTKKTTDTQVATDEQTDTIENGTVELTQTFTEKIEGMEYTLAKTSSDCYGCYEEGFFQIKKEDGIEFVDAEGNIALSSSCQGKDSVNYLGDGYFAVGVSAIYKNNEKVVSLDDASTIPQYRNGIVYYCIMSDEKSYLVAYDIEQEKELWKIERSGKINLYENYILEEISLENSKYDFDYRIINFDGEIIAEAMDESKLYPTYSNYYIKTEKDKYVDVYNLENEKISSLSLVGDGTVSPTLDEVLGNGMYIIRLAKDSYPQTEQLYNINGELIYENERELKGADFYLNCISDNYQAKISMAIAPAKNMILKTDGTGILIEVKIEGGYFANNLSMKQDYFMVEVEENNEDKLKIIDIESQEIVDVSEMAHSAAFEESPNKSYTILTSQKSIDRVYDSDYNELYSSSNYLKPVNDNYVIEIEESGKDNEALYLVNVFSGEKTKLDVKGEYDSHTSTGLVTYDGETYYLYAFR